MSERDDFGPGLRRERERRGITLEAIADRTKISASLFAAMERNDFSRWPGGLFRRSFLRAYAEVLGLDGEWLVQRSLRLFPSGDDAQPAPAPDTRPAVAAPSSPAGLSEERARHRATAPAAGGAPGHRTPVGRRLVATAVDLSIVAGIGLGTWMAFGWVALWPAVAGVATLVFVGSTLALQATFGAWLLRVEPASAALAPTPVARPIRERRPSELHHQTARRHQVRRVERQHSRI